MRIQALPLPHLPRLPDLSFIKKKIKYYYRNNTYVISSVTNLFLNTVVLVSHIFKQIPPLISRVSFTLLSFSGMISINMQGRDWSKHLIDCRLAWKFKCYKAFLLSAARVCVKGMNILMTCSVMAGALIALAGFPHITLLLFQALRPLSLIGLMGTISGEFIDYYSNKKLLKRIEVLKQLDDKEMHTQAVVKQFLLFAYQPAFKPLDSQITKDLEHSTDQQLALDCIRQLEDWPLDTLKQGWTAKSIGRHSVLNQNQSLELFYEIELKIKQSKNFTKTNIALIALGYVSMGICKLFPMTLIQYSVTWGMSALYTCRLLYMKFTLKTPSNNATE